MLDSTVGRKAVLTLTVAVAALILAPGASAKIIYKSHSETGGPQEQINSIAKCPKGSHVLGGGVTSNGDYYEAWVHSVYPIDTGDSDHKTDDGYTGSVDNKTLDDLKVTTYAICGKGKFTKHLIYRVSAGQSVDNVTQGNATAKCPHGAKVLGGGVSSEGLFGSSDVNATRPEDGPDGGSKRDDAWTGFVDAFPGDNQALQIRAVAICLKGKFAKGLRYKSASRQISGQSQGSAVAKCGSRMVLGGGVTNPSDYHPGGVVNATRPEDGGDHGSKRDDAWIGFVDNLANGDNLKVTAFAICHK